MIFNSCDAAAKESLSIVKYLIEKGADFKAKDTKGNTPLDIASKHYKYDIISYINGLLEAEGSIANTHDL